MILKFFRRFCGPFLIFYIFSFYAHSHNPTVWEEMSQQFSLNHEATRPEVQAQIQWIIHHPAYLQQLKKAEPYMYHIITEIKKRHLPGELALIPMVESAYNPFAYSGKGAAGLWQIMPSTGTDLGLKQNWWHDGRRNILSSTGAALNYLEYLSHFFSGNWLLAVAAYDAGEGAISRSIKNTHQTIYTANFWALRLPRETRMYIPRLLALAEVVKNAEFYHIQLPSIPHRPYFQEVTLSSHIDLTHAAKLAGVSYQDLRKLNPGYNHWSIVPHKPYKLLIPMHNVSLFSQNIAPKLNSPTETASWIRYKIRPRDNLANIATRYHSSIHDLQNLNRLKSNRLPLGQYILIPNNRDISATTPEPAHYTEPQAYKVIYIVDKKDDFQKIANKFKISVAQIQAWNNLTSTSILEPGQTLMLWKMYTPT